MHVLCTCNVRFVRTIFSYKALRTIALYHLCTQRRVHTRLYFLIESNPECINVSFSLLRTSELYFCLFDRALTKLVLQSLTHFYKSSICRNVSSFVEICQALHYTYKAPGCKDTSFCKALLPYGMHLLCTFGAFAPSYKAKLCTQRNATAL